MTVEDTRMKLAVRVVDRAFRSTADVSLDDRLNAFRETYVTLTELGKGTPEWTEDVLNVAWSLVEDAYPIGTDAVVLRQAMVATFATVSATAAAPPSSQPRRPRRDA